MKQAINTKTQEEYDALMRYYESKGIMWLSGHKATDSKFFSLLGAHTCVIESNESLKYLSIEECWDQKIPIIPYTEFAKANIPESPNYEERYREAVVCIKEMIELSNAGKTLRKIDSQVATIGRQFLTNHKDGE